MSEIETKTTDVLVIGGEGATLRTAIEAHDKGARTIIACKGRIGKSGSTMTAALHHTRRKRGKQDWAVWE